MVTREQLNRLRAERSQPNARLEYTIDGPTHARVVSSMDAERERTILLGERAMKDAQRDMRLHYALERHRGQAKATFNHKQEIKP